MKQEASSLKNLIKFINFYQDWWRREKTNITNIRNKIGCHFIPKAIKRIIIGDYYEKLNAQKFDIFKEMDQFQPAKLPNFNEDEIDNLSNPITIKDIESIL